MVAAGMNTVRMGEFVWGLCEPAKAQFDFSWLRRVMDLLGEEDIKVVLATPTAAPPIWLTKKHPEILPMDERGIPLVRRHPACLLSQQRSLLELFQENRARHGRGPWQTSPVDRLAN